MNNAELTYVLADDWVAMYVNGQLFAEGHSLHLSLISEIIDWKGPITDYRSFSVEDSWIEQYGSFPAIADDIPDNVRF